VKGYLAVPRVIRLMHFDRHLAASVCLEPPKHLSCGTATSCQYCGKKFPTSELSLDHAVSAVARGRELGGPTS